MPYKTIIATEARVGVHIIIDGLSCVVKAIDISKTGKHGASKCRIEAVGLLNGQKKIIAVPGHEKLEVPLVEKKKAQVLSASGEKVQVMDLETFETMDLVCDEEVKNNLQQNDTVEYWNVEGDKVIKRKI